MNITFLSPRDRGRNRLARFFGVAMVAVLLIPSWSWAAARQGLSGLERIDQAYQEGRLSYEQALNYKVDALFHPKDLPAEYRPSAPLKSGTVIMREVMAHRDRLTAKNLQWLDRPLDGSLPYAELDYGGVTVATYDSAGGHFRLHYTTENRTDGQSSDAVSSADLQNADGSGGADGVPDYVEGYARYLEEAWDHEIGTLGFSAPPSDGTLGGDGRRDVYIKNLSGVYGVTIYTDTPADTYMIVENDYNALEGFPANFDLEGEQKGAMKVTAAHEFFHVIQWQITTRVEINGWWMEATSTWMEDEVYPAVKDYLNYLDDWFSSPDLPLNTYNGWFEYGTVIWAKHLTENPAYGAGMIPEIWQAIDDTRGVNALEAIGIVLSGKGTSLAAELREFRAKNGALIYWSTPYVDGAYYRLSARVNKVYGDNATENYLTPFNGSCQASTGDCSLKPLSAYYYLFSTQTLSGSGSLTVSYQGAQGSVSLLVLPMTNSPGVAVLGSDTDPLTVDSGVSMEGGEGGTLTVTPFGPTAEYKQVMVVVLNTGESLAKGTLTVCLGTTCAGSGSGGGGSSGGSDNRCFIATAAYGSPLHPYVQILREFRDRYLLPHPAGAAFVEFYYRHSPPLAERITEDPVLKGATEAALIPAVVFAAFMVKTTLLEKGLFFLVVWWGLRRRRRG